MTLTPSPSLPHAAPNMSTNTTIAASSPLPPTYRALEFASPTTPAKVITKPTPSLPLPPGTALLAPLVAPVPSYASEILTNNNPRQFIYPLPFTPGPSAIARLIAAPPDTPSLTPNQLVFLDPAIRTRSDASTSAFLLGTHGGVGETFEIMDKVWRDGSWAEMVSVPVENVVPLDEAALFGEGRWGYTAVDLAPLLTLAVAYGGLDTAAVRPGEIVVVAPATGAFSGAGVHVALALGARVIAMGRNESALRELEEVGRGSVVGLKMSGSVEEDLDGIRSAAEKLGNKKKEVDVLFEISPPRVVDGSGQTVPYITAGMRALRKGGRAVLMGGIFHDVNLPVGDISFGRKSVQGWWMYTPEQLRQLVRMVETGVLQLGEKRGFKCAGVFQLEEWQQAFDTAAREAKIGSFAVLQPNKQKE